MEQYTVTNNKKLLRFEVELGGEFAYIVYRWYKGDIAFMHTVVPGPMQGKGIATLMAREALEYARTENLKIMLYCPFVSKYVREHPEYDSLIDKSYR
ncbi:MAG TPA: GNAT family N-acetyltransferase [Chitinophagaceae bacterium]|nr:GNAT family N-acetyltransferase [Chitinophagaceae bacterium]